jgi:acetyl esterase/lipase
LLFLLAAEIGRTSRITILPRFLWTGSRLCYQPGVNSPSSFPARRLFVVLLLAQLVFRSLGADEIVLWPAGAPGSEGKHAAENVRVTAGGDHVVTGVHRPSLTPFLPAADKANGAVVIVIPGGGHRELWMDHEGYNPARWLVDHGVAAFVLKYRLARETNSTYTIKDHALADTVRAVQLVRSRAGEWKLDPQRLGVMGFSAGGELAYQVCALRDSARAEAGDPLERFSSRPNFQALIYPGRSADIQPSKDAPPVFLACGFKDRQDIAEGLAEVYLRFKRAGVPAELHIYSSAGHGFGMRDKNTGPAAAWPERLLEWMGDSGFLKQP